MTSLTEEKDILIKENKMLKSEIQIHTERHEIQPVNENRAIFSAQTSKYLAMEEHNERESVDPLKEKTCGNAIYSVPSFSEKEWKI